jgi:uncharacterized membrane protein
MPEIGYFHPQLVHFVIAFGIIGVVFRIVSLAGRLAWTGPAAAALLLMAAVASVIAAEAGDQAHELAEQIPGVRPAMHDHEEAGEWARNILVLVGLLEVGAFAFRKKEKLAKGLMVGSALVGLAGVGALYRAGDFGGKLVYSFAGGVGTRSGDNGDVRRLLIAGLYHQARVARDSSRFEESARLTEELTRQAPDDPNVKLLGAESLLRDKKDPNAALAAISAIPVPPDSRFFAIEKDLLASEALAAAGQKDSARALLNALAQKYPNSRWIKDAIAKVQ